MIDAIQTRSKPASCRLCGGDVRRMFSLQVLRKYDVEYQQCSNCDSLQTEHPYWMQESYSSNLSMLDTGAGQRNLANLAAAFSVSRAMHLKDVLDFGGGDGLLCRLLRDYEINCFVNDKHAAASYARAFDTPDFERPQIVLAFEVMEHFGNPHGDLQAIFQLKPELILATTVVYANQGSDWWYLAPNIGQHVFFYSAKALRMIAQSHDYELLMCSGYVLFLAGPLKTRKTEYLMKILLQKHLLRIISAGMRLLPARGVWKDFESLNSK